MIHYDVILYYLSALKEHLLIDLKDFNLFLYFHIEPTFIIIYFDFITFLSSVVQNFLFQV